MADELDDDMPDLSKPAAKTQVIPPVTAPKTKAEPIPEVTKHTHTQRLITAATNMGFTQDDLDNFDSETIWAEIARVQEMNLRRKNASAPAAEPVKKAEEDPDEALLAELERDVHPPLAAYLRKQREEAKEARKQMAEKLAKLDSLEENEKKRVARQQIEMIDNAFSALPEKYKVLFGDGPMADIDDPGQSGWRMAVMNEAKLTEIGSQRSLNKKIAEIAVRMAKNKVAPDEPGKTGVESAYAAETPAPKKKAPAKDPETGRFTAEDFEGAKIAKGSGRQTGVEQVGLMEGARRILQSNGYMTSAAFEGDDDDMPG